MTDLAILLPYYDGVDYIERGFLDDVLDAAAAATPETAVLALDDASTDATREHLRDRSRLTVLGHAENTHYVGSVNDLLRYASDRLDPSAFMLLDQDATLDAGAIDRLWATLRANDRLGVVQPLVRDFRGGIYSAGHRFNRYRMCHPITREPEIDDRLVRRPSVTLLGTVVRAEVVAEVGILDERFGIYWESSDLGFRARKRGWDVALEPRAVARHDRYLSETDSGGLYHVYRNWPLFWAKYDPPTARRILDEYWPSTDGLAVGMVTEDVDEPADADFLARAAEDARERLGAFVRTVEYRMDDCPADRATVVRD